MSRGLLMNRPQPTPHSLAASSNYHTVSLLTRLAYTEGSHHRHGSAEWFAYRSVEHANGV